MPEIKIKIGAAVDQSMRTVFKPLTQAAHEARSAIQKEFAGLAVGMKGAFAEQGRTAKKEFTGISKAGADMSRDLERVAAERTKSAKRESEAEWKAYTDAGKNALRASEQLERQRSRGLYQQFRERERAARQSARAQESAIGRFAERTSHRATRFFMPNLPIMSLAHRAGSEVLQGLGVETSIAGLVNRGAGIESAATALSNRGHIEGAAGANGQVVPASVLQAEARAAGAKTAVNPEELLAAGREFVGLTGDLDLWRKIMPEVAARTKALGGSQEDAAKAAGEFAAHVGDVPDKAKAILDLVAVAGGQGKIGGVDFSDFAKYAAKAAAPAAQFQGDKAQNIGKLTALAEIAKMHGGASSAAEAFTSIASLTTTLKKPARFKSIQGLLGNKNGQFADNAHSTLKDPQQLIKDLIVAASKDAHGKSGLSSLDKLAAAVGDSRSMKAVSGLQNTFNEAGGGQKGLDAMNAELAKFSGAILSKDEVDRALGEQLKTGAAKAELFNQSLERITHGAMDKLAPALEHLEEPALRLAGYLGDLASWAAGNPWGAVAAAAAIALSRAILESGIRAGIEAAIKGSMGNVSLSSVSAKVATATLAVGALTLAWEELQSFKNQNGGWEGVKAFVGAGQDSDFGFSAINAEMDRQAKAKAEQEGRGPGGAKPADGARLPSSWDIPQQPGSGFALPGGAGAGASPSVVQLNDLKTEMVGVRAAIREMHSDLKGTLKVTVTNHEQPKAPTAGG